MTHGKRVVITGARSGFGEGAVKAFADHGYRVWGTMRNTEVRNAAKRHAAKRHALETHSPRIAIVEMEVTDDASVSAGFAEILTDGPVDVLINNAGIKYIGIDMALIEPGPFGTNLLAGNNAPARADVLETYGALGGVPTQMVAGFAAMLAGDGAPAPQLVVPISPSPTRPLAHGPRALWSASRGASTR